MNKIIQIGRLINEPETRFTKEGKGITTFTLAIRNTKDDSLFIKYTTFGSLAETIQNYVHKGDTILVEGIVKNNNYTDKDGNKHYEYVFIANKAEFLVQSTNHTKKEEHSKKEVKNGLDDETFRKFGESIEIQEQDLAF